VTAGVKISRSISLQAHTRATFLYQRTNRFHGRKNRSSAQVAVDSADKGRFHHPLATRIIGKKDGQRTAFREEDADRIWGESAASQETLDRLEKGTLQV